MHFSWKQLCSSLWLKASTYKSPFVYSFLCDTDLGWFPNLAIVNRAAINTAGKVFLWSVDFSLSGKSLTEGHTGDLLFILEGSLAILISILARPLYLHTSMEEGFSVVHLFTCSCYICFSNDCQSDLGEKKCPWSFDSRISELTDSEPFLIYALIVCISFENCVHFIFYWITQCLSSLCILDASHLSDIRLVKNLYSVESPNEIFFCSSEAFNSMGPIWLTDGIIF